MRALVTGGAGFLGSHLCRRLLLDGCEVICVDNLFTGRKCNIDDLLQYKPFKFIQHDVTQPMDFEVDEIYNLACPASPPHYQFDPVKTIKTCVLGMINVLELAQRCRAKVFQASTSEVYGDPDCSPQPETYKGLVNTIGPRACYDEGKRIAETLMIEYHKLGVDIRIARIFNTYGPCMRPDDGRVISNFIVQALQDKPLTIYGDGQQTRSFCYVADLIDGILGLMQSRFTTPVNLGNPEEITMIRLIELLERLLNTELKIQYFQRPQDDPYQRCPDITLARSFWVPRVSLDVGLQRTINWFEKNL
jgi:UDP-glucuronate decarboxylase